MYSDQLVRERLLSVLEALERVPRRFEGIKSPSDFYASEEGIDRLDAICMVLIAAGEEIKAIDRRTEGKLLAQYPHVKWRGVMGVRDVLAHGYFEVNAEQLFAICQHDVPELIATVRMMIRDIDEQQGSRM